MLLFEIQTQDHCCKKWYAKQLSHVGAQESNANSYHITSTGVRLQAAAAVCCRQVGVPRVHQRWGAGGGAGEEGEGKAAGEGAREGTGRAAHAYQSTPCFTHHSLLYQTRYRHHTKHRGQVRYRHHTQHRHHLTHI